MKADRQADSGGLKPCLSQKRAAHGGYGVASSGVPEQRDVEGNYSVADLPKRV